MRVSARSEQPWYNLYTNQEQFIQIRYELVESVDMGRTRRVMPISTDYKTGQHPGIGYNVI